MCLWCQSGITSSLFVGLVVSLSLPCLAEDTLMSKVIGVVGIDVSLEDLTDKVVSSNKQGLYAFLIDVKGEFNCSY